MMGAWMLVTGLASLFAGDFSGMVPEPSEGSALTTNPSYSVLFAELGCGTLRRGHRPRGADPVPAQAHHGQGEGAGGRVMIQGQVTVARSIW